MRLKLLGSNLRTASIVEQILTGRIKAITTTFIFINLQ